MNQTFYKHARKYLLSLSSLLLTGLAHAQTLQWQIPLGGTGTDISKAIAQAHDSGYVVAGSVASADGDVPNPHGGYDYWLSRLSPAGSLMWKKNYGGSSTDMCYGVRAVPGGGYILAGTSYSSDGDVLNHIGAGDVWVIRTDDTGAIVWQKNYGGTGDECAVDIITTLDGGFALAGYTASNDGDVTGFHGGTGADCWVLKIDDTGAVQWQHSFGGTRDDGAHVIRQTADTGFLLGGFTMSVDGDVTNYHGGTSDGGDCWAVKIDKNGTKQWQKTYGGSMEEQIFDIIELHKGNYLLGAATASSNGDITDPKGGADGWMLRVNDTGGIVWQKTYGGTEWQYITSMLRTADNYIVCAGWGADMWMIKTDTNGVQQWEHSFGGSNSDEGWAITAAPDGGYVVAGNTRSNDGDVSGQHSTSSYDIWVAKVLDPSGISILSANAQPLAVYPNPTNGIVLLSDIKQPSVASLYDMSGRCVGRWQLEPNSQSRIDITTRATGTYQLCVTGKDGAQQYAQIVKW